MPPPRLNITTNCKMACRREPCETRPPEFDMCLSTTSTRSVIGDKLLAHLIGDKLGMITCALVLSSRNKFDLASARSGIVKLKRLQWWGRLFGLVQGTFSRWSEGSAHGSGTVLRHRFFGRLLFSQS